MNELKYQLRHFILDTLVITGGLFIAITAPNLFQAFASNRRFPKSNSSKIRRSLKAMRSKGLVSYNNYRFEITRKGLKELNLFKIANIQIKDNRISNPRLVVFDIPVAMNYSRKIFTTIIKQLGFRCLQKSVWCINKKCEEEVYSICEMLQIKNYVSIVVVKEFK